LGEWKPDPDGRLCQATNLLLAAECVGLAVLAARGGGPEPVAGAVVFALAAAAFAIGAATHRSISLGRGIPAGLWLATLGAGHGAMVALTVALVWPLPLAPWARVVTLITTAWLAPLVAIVRRRLYTPQRVDQIVWIGTLTQLCTTALLMLAVAGATVAGAGGRGRYLLLGASAVVLAVAVQIVLKRRRRGLLFFDYNSIFHVLMGVAFWLTAIGLG
jgi:hypothetical protein